MPDEPAGSRFRSQAHRMRSNHDEALGPFARFRTQLVDRLVDVSQRRWHLRFVNDQTVPINDAYVRPFHRHVKSSKIVHGSFSSCDGADPIGLLRRAANHYPMLKKASVATQWDQ